VQLQVIKTSVPLDMVPLVQVPFGLQAPFDIEPLVQAELLGPICLVPYIQVLFLLPLLHGPLGQSPLI